MKRDYKLFIKDILDSITKIEKFIKNMNFEQFVKDEKTNNAVIHKLEIIGEATKNIPPDIRNKYKEIPWSDMAKIRDKISHFYFGIRYEIIWKVVKKRLPQLKPVIKKILNDLNKD